MHCCGAARSRIPICLLRNHPSGDPRLLCCSRLMVVPSLMIEGSSSSSSCLVAQNTPVCPRNCVVLHPKHSHRWPRRSRRYPRLPSFCRNVCRTRLILASERESPQEIARNRRPLRPPRLEAADGRGLRKPLPTGRGLGHPTPQRAALPTAADRALLSPRAPPSSRRGMQLPRKPARNLWAEGTCCAHQGFHRHSKHTHSTHRQHSHAGYQYPPLGTMGGAHATQSRGGETNDFGAEKTRRGTSSRLR